MASNAMYVNKRGIEETVKQLTDKKSELTNLGNNLKNSLDNALEKEKGEIIATLKSKIGNNTTPDTLLYLVQKQVPDLIEGLISLLNENLKAIEETDAQLASSIRQER